MDGYPLCQPLSKQQNFAEFSLSRFAKTQPAVPAPIIMKSASAIMMLSCVALVAEPSSNINSSQIISEAYKRLLCSVKQILNRQIIYFY